MKKRFAVAITTSALVFAGAGVAAAATVGTPEVDPAAATISAKPAAPWTAKACAGEDGQSYVTYFGTWVGSENGPASTDYVLTGRWTVKAVTWTINTKTGRGVLEGNASLVSPSPAGAASITYQGPLTLITQGIPDQSTRPVPARGFLNARTYTNSAPDGGSLLANVEFNIFPGMSASGEFGGSMGTSDLSAAYNNHIC
jgi:hypothetical protein